MKAFPSLHTAVVCSTEIMGACSLFEDGRRATIEKFRGVRTPSSVLCGAGTAGNISHRLTQSPQSPGESTRDDGDTRRAHTVIQMGPPAGGKNKTTCRSTWAIAGALRSSLFALLLALALAPSSVQASASPLSPPSSSSSCVQITETALYSSCASREKVADFTFTMEATAAGTTTAHEGKTETGGLRAKAVTSTAAAAAAAANTIATPPGGPFEPCPATGVVVTIGFAAPVTSVAYPDDPASGANTATFYVETLESNPTQFSAVLDTTGVAAGTNVVTHVKYSDNEGNSPDMSSLVASLVSAPECGDGDRTGDGGAPDGVAAATGVSRELHAGFDVECNVCFDLTPHQVNVLDMYDNGGKEIVCDPTCLDEVSDHTHCNYFELGQICRGCGDCSACTPCPAAGETPAPTPSRPEAAVSKPPFYDVTSRTASPVGMDSLIAGVSTSAESYAAAAAAAAAAAGDGDGDGSGYQSADAYDCSRCTDISDAQKEALASYDNGGKKVVCDPTCMDTVSDHIYCNYFGLGQICRACGECSTCVACPTTASGDSPAPAPTPGATKAPAGMVPAAPADTHSLTTSAPMVDSISGVGSGKTFTSGGNDEEEDDECAPCMDLTDGQVRALDSWDNGGKRIVCDPTCLDGVSDRTHCNYYNLGDICRGCGDCTDCVRCP